MKNIKFIFCIIRRVDEAERRKIQAGRKKEEKVNEMNERKRELESKLAEIEASNREVERYDESAADQRLKVIVLPCFVTMMMNSC